MASLEAVQRRRDARKARTQNRHARRQEREKHQSAVAKRMVVRFFGTMPPHPTMTLSYVYWQARRCGWDALHRVWARRIDGQPCEPEDGVAWLFWKTLHYRTRDELVRLSTFRLIRRR